VTVGVDVARTVLVTVFLLIDSIVVVVLIVCVTVLVAARVVVVLTVDVDVTVFVRVLVTVERQPARSLSKARTSAPLTSVKRERTQTSSQEKDGVILNVRR
jgi:hypothetical protein